MLAGSLDTNVVLRLLLEDIPAQHRAAVQLFDSVQGQLAIADVAFMEIAFVLERHYQLKRSQINEAIRGLLELSKINANRALFAQALPLFVRHGSLSFEDCCLAVYAELNQAEPLYTFDQKLARHAPGTKLLATL